MYNFANKSDEELHELIMAAMTEETNRILRKIGTYPKPYQISDDKIADIKLYRETHKVSLREAKMVVEYHYLNNQAL